jgi:drug/metabolite transporter (DMT)-like permease
MRNIISKQSVAPSWLPTIGLIVAMVVWASSYVAMKFALQAYHPLLVVFGRMALASLIFLAFRTRLGGFPYQRGDWKYLGLMALCEPCLYFLFESYALTYTSSSQAAIVAALLPVSVTLVAALFLNERASLSALVGFGLALAGIAVITLASRVTEHAPNPLLGNALEVIAILCASIYTVLARFLSRRYSPWCLTAFQMSVGAVFFTPILLLSGAPLPAVWPVGPTLAIVYLGGCVSVLAYGLYNYGLQHIPASRASGYVNLIPVFAVLLGWWCFGERLTGVQFGGMGLVLLGVWLSSRPLTAPQKEEYAPSCGRA